MSDQKFDFQELIKDQPELESVLKSFGETMKAYTEALQAMGAGSTYRIEAVNTAQGVLHLTTASTILFEIKK